MLNAPVVDRFLARDVDAVGEAVDRLESLLPREDENAVLVDFLEDDLREGLSAVADLEAHFHDILEALRSEQLTPAALLEAGSDYLALRRLESLHVVVAQMRRRVAQVAGRMRKNPIPDDDSELATT